MFKKLSSAVTSLAGTPADSPPPEIAPSHHTASRAEIYVDIAKDLSDAGVPVDVSDCATCDRPCPIDSASEGSSPSISEVGRIWDGKSYDDYVLDKYGELDGLPSGFDTDWGSELPGSGSAPKGRVVVISTGKSDWEHNHLDEKKGFAHKLDKYISKLPAPDVPAPVKGGSGRPPVENYVSPAVALGSSKLPHPSLYSSSIISQSDDPEDETVLVFPDWKVVHEVENSQDGAEGLFQGALKGNLGKAGGTLSGDELEGVGRRRSWVMPYRAVVLLCSHKKRDKRCHIAAPLLRSALITCLEKHDITVDETGQSLINLPNKSLEETEGTEAEREAEVDRQVRSIEGVEGGDGGEVGIFNINHLGGHRYAGVMLVLFPSGAFMSYGRVTPQEIPRVVEETILKGKMVPGLLRNAAGVARQAGQAGKGFLGW